MIHPFSHTSIILRFKPLLALVISLFALAANAYDFMVDGLCYNINNYGKSVTVTYGPRSGALTIPPSVSYGGKSYSVTYIGDGAFYICSGLTSITIPNSVTEIGYEAFENCSGLTSIYAYLDPKNIKLGSYAFRDVPTATCVLYVPTLYLDDINRPTSGKSLPILSLFPLTRTCRAMAWWASMI